MNRIYIILILIQTITACSPDAERKDNNKSSNKYARGFMTEIHDNYTKVTIHNPWEKAENISIEYILIDKNTSLPDSFREKKIIRTPVERIVCLSTTHLAFLEILNETGSVAGISGIKYISSPEIRNRFKKGKIPDVGYGQNLNYELLVNQKPDLVMAYALGSEVTAYSQKLNELGIPVVIIAEYLEETPLGKAEWIKFVGHLFGKEQESIEFFNQLEKKYLELRELTSDVSDKPGIMTGMPHKDAWWVPGGNSYLANLIADAGGHYIGKKNTSHESYVISFENALVWGTQADIWINTGNLTSKKEILAVDQRFNNFRVFREGKIFNNIKRLSPEGGNDFWESGTVNPHLILRDLINAFHPGLTDDEMIYYKEIK